MKAFLVFATACIALFGIASGAYKLMGGEADVRIFASLGMGGLAVRFFGLVQAAASMFVFHRRAGALAAWTLTFCNALATAGLFAAGVQPFGWVSILFIVMALVAVHWTRGRRLLQN